MQIKADQPIGKVFFSPPPTGHLQGSSRGVILIPPSNGARPLFRPLTKEAQGRFVIIKLAEEVLNKAPNPKTSLGNHSIKAKADLKMGCLEERILGRMAKEIRMRNYQEDCWIQLRAQFREYYKKHTL
ncbi:MAG: hypothetical protein LW832_06030 [Parachlamydia sp.]|jgi:hypothetical protein|nr:hypothetical protein [Parachlamydia sp.]